MIRLRVNNLYIDSDSHNFLLKEKCKNTETKEIYYKTLGYCSSIENCVSLAIKKIGLEIIAKGKIVELKEFIAEINKIKKHIKTIITKESL